MEQVVLFSWGAPRKGGRRGVPATSRAWALSRRNTHRPKPATSRPSPARPLSLLPPRGGWSAQRKALTQQSRPSPRQPGGGGRLAPSRHAGDRRPRPAPPRACALRDRLPGGAERPEAAWGVPAVRVAGSGGSSRSQLSRLAPACRPAPCASPASRTLPPSSSASAPSPPTR